MNLRLPDPPWRQSFWSGFRGRGRNAVLEGVRINSDWNAAKPMQVWRRRVGPGWSSFAVAGELIFTQEQRGDHELISAYRLSTGEPVWGHQDAARFYESAGGPRNTHGTRRPCLCHGRDRHPECAGREDRRAHLDAQRGTRHGCAAAGLGVCSVADPADERRRHHQRRTRRPHPLGESLRRRDWHRPATGARDGSVLAPSAEMLRGLGVRRLAVSRAPDGTWKVDERWTSRGLKPYFNDFVVHRGHAYGFDGTILSAINLETGERVWKGGRYGAGQMLLLPQQDLLLVVSEEGDLVLVAASPDQHSEIAKFQAIEGKTWDHPVLVGDVLLVRNGEEMAAFRLAR